MKTTFISLIAVLALFTLTMPAQAKDTVWNCPDGEYARKAIISGEVEDWPYFSPGPGMRVQKQHPKTALTGQAKYIEGNGTSGAICQYYSHIGFVITMYAIGAKKHKINDESYWREEYKESSPEQDEPDNPMMEVCMVNKDDLAYMSVGCPFLLSED
ncbi:MAG: hypothetical protein EX271_10220 [Acidimicrobiales bacterium]|nr:hypothetical protein [Hyphomonadaceae bacterium]RZV40123.1 MAG: hypothetical protein EX271_10220 [Acidimicrobiales bacterium]